MVAYYDFEESGAAGLTNKAPGASGGDLSWGGSPVLSTTGFTGDASFAAPDGISNRGSLLAGGVLNLVDAENAFVTAPIGSADLGSIFTLSIWTYLAPGSENTSSRFHALESSDPGVWDVSWGTTSTVSSTAYDDYLVYVETTAAPTISGLAPESWQHVLLEYDTSGANPTVSAYVNGATIPVTASDSSGTFSFSGLNIGRYRNDSADRDWDGMIDEVAIWDRALDEAERGEVYARGLAGVAVPEPSSLFLFGAFGALALLHRRKA
ncbi:LamG-like jellyroll fold domain-containing protein [Luteolibacter marinus]|uniref:LamG-like jellyroll fold domain-containing protein n=1 Tax=Luteolibacter marinus TaxID=2776705 RepID=UPI0018681DF3|nr:LamG-like jellyroll fold domain-containing protein [Luteolibacter marinus]